MTPTAPGDLKWTPKFNKREYMKELDAMIHSCRIKVL